MNHDRSIWAHCLQHAAKSDVGLRRANNQDSLAVAPASSQDALEQRGHVFMVADGMGAHAAGELASQIAATAVPLAYQKLADRSPSEALLEAVSDANRQIHNRGQASPEFKGMGTTATVLVLLPQGAVLGHVGDSRAYRLRGNRLEQLTFDHSLVWEMRKAGQIPEEDVPGFISKNIITRSLGPNPAVQVDLEGPFPLAVGDTFLLCSDGLSGQVKDDEIGAILATLPPEEAVQTLVDLANLRGGPDNITVIVARVLGPQIAQDAAAGAERGQAAGGQADPSGDLGGAGRLCVGGRRALGAGILAARPGVPDWRLGDGPGRGHSAVSRRRRRRRPSTAGRWAADPMCPAIARPMHSSSSGSRTWPCNSATPPPTKTGASIGTASTGISAGRPPQPRAATSPRPRASTCKPSPS